MPFGFRRNHAAPHDVPAHRPVPPPLSAAGGVAVKDPTRPPMLPPRVNENDDPPAPQVAAPSMRVPPMKGQATGNDARAERFFREVRAEVDDLRRTLSRVRELDEELTELDLDAVTSNPEGAAALPPAVLVRALVESHRANGRLQRRLQKSRDRIARLENRIRDLKQQQAYESGRLETLDRVIAALHANLEDLRLARDSETPRVEAPPEPRVLRSASQTPALEPRNAAENA
ncbi:MAG: hypothetical protein AB7T37_14445 [Dehalococcoidia bacterium]